MLAARSNHPLTMKLWTLPNPAAPGSAPAPHPLVALVGAIGLPGFAQCALAGLNQAQLQAASWSVYRVWRQRPPVKYLSASVGVADTTEACFDVYRQGLYRLDRSFDAVVPGQVAMLRMHADDAPSAQHREAIYRRHGMVERLSVVQREDDDALFAVNLYHHAHQGRFSDGELAGFAGLARLLLAAVQRHVALAAPAAAAPQGGLRAALQARCPALTGRELDVCERLLRGWTYDGIAADLGLGLATVKTYRARAFDRLGLHFKSELFAAFLPVQGGSAASGGEASPRVEGIVSHQEPVGL